MKIKPSQEVKEVLQGKEREEEIASLKISIEAILTILDRYDEEFAKNYFQISGIKFRESEKE